MQWAIGLGIDREQSVSCLEHLAFFAIWLSGRAKANFLMRFIAEWLSFRCPASTECGAEADASTIERDVGSDTIGTIFPNRDQVHGRGAFVMAIQTLVGQRA